MKYVAFTTKHHDGFCMFDTATTDYRITHPDCPFHDDPRADVTREVFDAFRQRGMGISCYFSKSDWHCPWYWSPDRPAPDRNPNYSPSTQPRRWEKFVRFVHAQVAELMTNYGHIDTLWLDGGQVRPPEQDIDMNGLVAMSRAHQPGLIVMDRTVGGVHENVLTPEQGIPDKPLDWYWECCLTMGESWSFKPRDQYKSTRQLVQSLIDIVAKGGNLLLNVGADPLGRFDPVALERLKEIGDWMAVNAEAIHGTRPIAPYVEGNIRYTAKGGTIYAIVLNEANEQEPPPQVTLKHLRPRKGESIHMLGAEAPLTWQEHGDVCQVDMPHTIASEPTPAGAWVLRFNLA